MHQDEMVDMDRLALEESGSRFAAFVGSLNEVIGHRDRIGPFRFRLRTIMRAFPSRIVSICLRSGRMMRTGASKRACLRILSSQPSLRSRWRRSRKPFRTVFRKAWS